MVLLLGSLSWMPCTFPSVLFQDCGPVITPVNGASHFKYNSLAARELPNVLPEPISSQSWVVMIRGVNYCRGIVGCLWLEMVSFNFLCSIIDQQCFGGRMISQQGSARTCRLKIHVILTEGGYYLRLIVYRSTQCGRFASFATTRDQSLFAFDDFFWDERCHFAAVNAWVISTVNTWINDAVFRGWKVAVYAVWDGIKTATGFSVRAGSLTDNKPVSLSWYRNSTCWMCSSCGMSL